MRPTGWYNVLQTQKLPKKLPNSEKLSLKIDTCRQFVPPLYCMLKVNQIKINIILQI